MALTYDSLIAYINGLYADGTMSTEDYNKTILYILANGDLENTPRDLIQVRRGNIENIPALAQGELAFTLDTEELFIGGVNGNIKLPKTANFVNVLDYGAKGDGATDDSAAIQAAIAALPKTGGVLFFPKGIYLHGDGVTTSYDYTPYTISASGSDIGYKRPDYASGASVSVGRDIRLLFNGYNNILIVGYGAKIISNGLNGEVMHNSIFWFENCENITIKGLEIDGNIDARQPEYSDYTPGGGRWYARHNFEFLNCDRFTLSKLKVNNSMMDGLCIDENCSNFTIDNCEIHYNYRQGITIGSNADNIRVVNCDISYTGRKYGTLPKAGIDLEGNAGGSQTNVVIEDCTFTRNKGESVALYLHTIGVTIKNCTMNENEALRGTGIDNSYNNTIESCKFYNENIEMRQKGTLIKDCIFKFDKNYGIEHVKGGTAILIDTTAITTVDFDIVNARNSIIDNCTIIVDYTDIGTSVMKARIGKIFLKDAIAKIKNCKLINASTNQAGVYLLNIDCDVLYMLNNEFTIIDTVNADAYSQCSIVADKKLFQGNLKNGYLSGTFAVGYVNTIDV